MPLARHARTAVLAASLAVSLAVAGAPALAQDTPDTARRVAVTGSADVSTAPDRATVSLGVVTEALTAADAMEANNAAVRTLLERLQEQGIAARDLQTSGFSVSPQYVYPPRAEDGTQEPPSIVGYTVSNSVTARLRALETLGDVLDASVRAGANQIEGISFDVSNADELKDEARKAAFDNARRKAELYAQAAGATLGPVLSVSETSRSDGPPFPNVRRLEAAKADSVPIESGEQTLSVQVDVVWGLAE